MPKKAASQTSSLGTIDWSEELVKKVLTELEKDENSKILFGKKDPNDVRTQLIRWSFANESIRTPGKIARRRSTGALPSLSSLLISMSNTQSPSESVSSLKSKGTLPLDALLL